SQTPSVSRSQAMPTRSPRRKRRHAGPSRSTTPTTWWPGTRGRRWAGRSPSMTCRSVRQIADARTRTRISPDPGSGSASWMHSRGRESIGPWRRRTMARIEAFLAAPSCYEDARRRSGAVVTAPADSEEAQLVIGDVESVGLPDAPPHARENVGLDEAPVDVLDLPALPADEVVVMRRERLGQLVAALPLRGVRRAHEADVAKQLHGAVDRDEVDALSTERTVELGDRARLLARRQRVEDGPTRRRDPVPSAREEPRDRVPRILEDGWRDGVRSHCVPGAGGSTPTAR